MTTSESRAGAIVRWNGKKAEPYVQTITVDPGKEAAERLGKVFGVVAVEAVAKTGDALVAHIEDALNRGIAMAMRKLPVDAPQDTAFEMAIGAVNYAAERLLGDNGLPVDPERVTAALVAVRDRDVAAAIWGSPSLLLFHPSTSGDRVLNLVDDSRTEKPSHARLAMPRRCFGSIIAGAIGKRDRLLLATQNLENLLGDRLAEIVLGMDPMNATEAIRIELAPAAESLALAALVIDVADVRYIEQLPGSTKESLDALRQTASRTKEIMSPSLKISIPRLPRLRLPPLRLPRLPTLAAIKRSPDRLMTAIVDNLNALTARRRAALFAFLAVLAAVNMSAMIGAWNRDGLRAAAAYEADVAAAQQQIDAAEASIIYHDDDHAKTSLAGADAATVALRPGNAKQKSMRQNLEKEIAEKKDELRHVVALAAPEVIATVGSGADAATIVRLAALGDSLWGATADGGVFTFPGQGKMTKLATIAGEPALFLAAGSGVLAASKDGSATLIANGAPQPLTVALDATEAGANDAQLYNARIYVLDAAHNRIVRHAADGQNFGAAQFYLKDGTDLSQTVSMAIDGAVWLLRRDGGIIRIVKGLQEPFAVQAVDPAVTAAKKIRTASASGSLYVLDSSPARILRFDKKTGLLQAQYVADALADASDFAVDETAHALLVAKANQVLKFTLPQ